VFHSSSKKSERLGTKREEILGKAKNELKEYEQD
jgi:hypothetical protein